MFARQHAHIRIHCAAHARRVLAEAAALSHPVVLVSPVDAVAIHGSQWFMTLCQTASCTAPSAQWRTLVDCTTALGHAMAALQAGADSVLLDSTCNQQALERLRDLAARSGQQITLSLPERLDLMAPNAMDDLRPFIAAAAF